MKIRSAGVLLLLCVSLRAAAGTLTTRDGKTYSGALQLRPAEIAVLTEQGVRTVPLSSVVLADFKAGGAQPPKPGHGLRGDYFVGRNLKRLLLTRTDPAIDYNWTDTLPHPSLVQWGREFSVRWTGQLRPDRSEKYTIITNTDDGVRVWLDDKLVIDHWYDSAGGDVTAQVQLEKDRRYALKVEYYNGRSDARAALSWGSPSTPRQIIPPDNLLLPPANTPGQRAGSNTAGAPSRIPAATTQAIKLQTPSTDTGPAFERRLVTDNTGLKAEYFADRELGTLNFVRFDPNIDFHFLPDTPPDPAMSPEGSIRWTGMLEPRYTEDYRFHAEVHRRIRLWVDGKLIIDQWKGEGGEYSSERIPLVAGKKVPFKVEYTSPNGFMLCRLRWSSKSQGRDTIPPDAFSVAPDEKLARPVVGLVYPAADAFLAAPPALALHATGASPNGRIEKLVFYDRNSPIADMDAQPFRFVWNKPAPGVYKLRAKLTDAAGVTALSDFCSLTITGKGNGSIKAPWGDFFIANNDNKAPGTASQQAPDAFKIENAVGNLVGDSEHDAAHLIVQPLLGDGQIIARVTALDPLNDISGAMAGVTIRENLKNRCKQFSMLYGQTGEEPAAAFVRRQDHWMNPISSEKAMKLPAWFKLARHGQRVYAYFSADGKDWDLFATERFESAPQVFAGLVAFSRDAQRPAAAAFDHVRLIPGAPALESSAKGFVTRGGTFVAADVFAIDDNFVRYARNAREGAIPLKDVARILYKPLLLDHAAKLSPGRAGVLLTTGDFIEGDVRTLKEGNVAVSSVLFGLRKVPLADDVTAVVLHDVAPEKTPFTVSTTDGSLYHPKSIKPDPQDLQIDIDDASLGKIAIPLGTLSQLRAE